MVTVYSEKVNKKEDGDGVTPPITPPITELVQKIIDMVGLKSTITRKELAEILEVGMDTVKEYLEKLKHKGVLMRIGNNRSGYWKIKDS
jgi:ATP-dependent DNA helicase RecG